MVYEYSLDLKYYCMILWNLKKTISSFKGIVSVSVPAVEIK